MQDDPSSLGREIRALVRRSATAGLATRLAEDGWPYVSLVAVAADHAGRPLLMLSDLAEHTRNLREEPRAGLLFDGTADADQPLAGSRATLLGTVRAVDDAALLTRYVARHPDAERYAGFADFKLYRFEPSRAHLVAGFGRIHWVGADALLAETAGAEELAVAEPDICVHMTQDHADALALYATRLAHAPAGDWRMVGIDPEGLDLVCGRLAARIDFETPVASALEARERLVQLAETCRNLRNSGECG